VGAMQSLRHDFQVAAAMTVLLTVVSGCGKTEHAGSASAASAPAVKKVADPAELALANMVSAVASGKPSGDIELKFDLRERPVVGEPVDIDLAIITSQDLDRVYASFQPGEGLELTKGAKTPEIPHPAVGVPISHTLTVVPQREGVFYVSAVVLADSAAQSVTRSFSIPLIAGTGTAVPPAPGASASGGSAPKPHGH
jgi:hypothetical protein